jgi:hypothetical protein
MSGRRSKARRRHAAGRPLRFGNAEYALASAHRVLAVELSLVPVDRVTQFVVGWLRASFEQSKVVATLALVDMSPAAAPNRRCFIEIAMRLHWLHDLPQSDRAGAVDAMLDAEREQTLKTFDHLREMGWEEEPDFEAMNAFVLNVTSNGQIKDQARKFSSAAHATVVKNPGPFRAWREESSYAHATGYLAGAYAPVSGDIMGVGLPHVLDPDLDAHRMMTVFVIMLTYRLLVEEGTDEALAMTIVEAFFELDDDQSAGQNDR